MKHSGKILKAIGKRLGMSILGVPLPFSRRFRKSMTSRRWQKKWRKAQDAYLLLERNRP